MGLFKYGMRGESSIIRGIQEWAGKEWLWVFWALIFPVELEEFSQPEMLQFSKSRGKHI